MSPILPAPTFQDPAPLPEDAALNALVADGDKSQKVKNVPSCPPEHISLGDHLRRRRLELGPYQKDVAAQLGVTTSSIWHRFRRRTFPGRVQ